ncbi:MAG: cold-shock protein [Rhizobiaceae bacterium]|nr:cold-shock protein [Rhizobiaceae bacterium]
MGVTQNKLPSNAGSDVFVHAVVLQKCGINGLNEGQKVPF